VSEYVSSSAVAMQEQTTVTKDISDHSGRLVVAVESILLQTRQDSRDGAARAA
jgi:hypothetical protein